MRRWLIRGTLMLISLAVSIAIAEVVVRKVAPQNDFIFGMSIYEADEAADYRLAPNLRTRQGATMFQTNALGFRNHEITTSKPAHVKRIICLGDSMTFGLQIQREDGPYPQQLEKLLNDGATKPRYEVLNAGISGYGTDQAVATLRTRLLALSPDIVTIGFFPSNDVTDNLYQGEKEVYQGLIITARDDRTHTLGTRVRATLHRWLMPLHLYRYLLLRWKSASDQPATKAPAQPRAAPTPAPAPAEDAGGLVASRRDELSLPAPGSSGWKLGTEDVLGRTLAVFHKTPTPLIEELGWPNTFRNFRDARDLAQQHGFELYVVLLPDRLAVDDANREKLIAQLGEDGADLDFELPLRRAKEFLAQEGIATIDVLPALRATGLGAQLFIVNDRHLNPRGCQVVATEIARAVRGN